MKRQASPQPRSPRQCCSSVDSVSCAHDSAQPSDAPLTSAPGDDRTESHLEGAVRCIQRDTSLRQEEKHRRIHELMCGQARLGRCLSNVTKDKKEEELVQSWHNKEKGILGCKHYARKCKMMAACCGEYVGCRLCHDEKYGAKHTIDRTKTERVWCMVCGAKDLPAQQSCQNCGVQFASYYCDKCKLWDGAVSPGGKSVYHCDGCGCCRLGKGLGIDSAHCDKCRVCYPIAQFSSHKCIERSLECDCPICAEYLADSRERVIFFRRCGHAIHASCFAKHFQTRYTCPVCMKSVADMSEIFRLLDKKVKDDQKNMASEYKNKVCKVLCQDCHQESETKYHFLYHRCGNCNSYNTRKVEVYNRQLEGSLEKPSRIGLSTQGVRTEIPSSADET